MATQMSDILFFAIIAGGVGMVALNWKCLTDGTLCGLGGGGSGHSGNCSYNQTKDPPEYCWNGSHTQCQNGKTVIVNQTKCITCTSSDRTACCNSVRGTFLESFPNRPCTGGGGSGGCVSNVHNNNGCSYDCRGGFCWKGSYLSCNPPGYNCVSKTQKNCVTLAASTSTTSGCAQARSYFCQQHSPDGKCGSSRTCPAGKAPGPNGNCVAAQLTCAACYTKNNQGNCVLNYGPAQAWVARVAAAVLGRMCTSGCARAPSITQVVQGWPSLTLQLAKDNGCSTNKLHTSYAPFRKNFALLLSVVAKAYALGLSQSAAAAIISTYNGGAWAFTPWQGGVPAFMTRTQALPTRGLGLPSRFDDNREGDSYAGLLRGRYNTMNPYGDSRYAYTLPDDIKIQVAR